MSPGKMLALKGRKQFPSLCKWPFHGELMLFPKVRAHCCWAVAKGSLPSHSGGGNNAHVCHFLTPVEVAAFDIHGRKKNQPKTHLENQRPLPSKNSTFQIASLWVQCLSTSCSAVQGRVLLSGDSAPCCPAGPRGRGRSRRGCGDDGGGSGTSHIPHLPPSAPQWGLQGIVLSVTVKLEPKIISKLSKYIRTRP